MNQFRLYFKSYKRGDNVFAGNNFQQLSSNHLSMSSQNKKCNESKANKKAQGVITISKEVRITKWKAFYSKGWPLNYSSLQKKIKKNKNKANKQDCD